MLLIPNHRTWAASLVGFLSVSTWLVSASSDTGGDATDSALWQVAAPISGFKPLYGIQDPPVTLDKRQSTCAANGSNYCFGDNVSYCSTCGICCGSSSSGYCCASDQLCCGSACCASGQTCTDGKCLLPVETIVVTSAALVTVSHVATQQVTVVEAVVSTSTVFATTEITVSSGGTQTDITYVTVTAAAGSKRAAVVDALEPREAGLWSTLRVFSKRFSFAWTPDVAARSEPLGKRDEKATESVLPGVSSSVVVTTSITQTSDITSFVSATTTVPTTSVVIVTVVQTQTKVQDAQTTIKTTSTLTVTPKAASTETVTRTATNPASSNTSTSSSSSSSSSPTNTSPPSSGTHLSHGAIAGIAGGIGGAAVLLLVLGLLVWYRRRRSREPPHQDPSSYLEPYIPDMSSPIPPPRGGGGGGTSPSQAQLNRFSASAPHPGGLAGAAAATGKPTNNNLDRYANISGGPPGRKSLSPRIPPGGAVEAPGGEVYEADGTEVRPAHVYEADEGNGRQQPPYPVDAGEMEGSTPTSGGSPASRAAGGGHSRNVSSGSWGYGRDGERGEGFGPVLDAGDGGGGGGERLRITNPSRQPGAYRDF